MGLSVKDRGNAVATWRYVHVELMEMLAQWTPTTPEMEVKLLFGEHIWNVAQQADAFGKRTHELRLPLQQSRKPVGPYVRLLADVRGTSDTAQRISGLYDALLPGLAARYQQYLGQTDTLMDAPTVRILEQCRDLESRMIEQSRALRAEFPHLGQTKNGWLESLLEREMQIESLVDASEE